MIGIGKYKVDIDHMFFKGQAIFEIESSYPWKDKVKIRYVGETALSLNLAVRLPGWSKNNQVVLNAAVEKQHNNRKDMKNRRFILMMVLMAFSLSSLYAQYHRKEHTIDVGLGVGLGFYNGYG